MGVANEYYQMTGQNKSDIKPTSKDSARYRGGFEQGLKGMKGMPNEGNVEKMGRWEGQNANKKATPSGATKAAVKPKAKTGMKVKPAAKKAMMMKKASAMKASPMMKKGGKMSKSKKY